MKLGCLVFVIILFYKSCERKCNILSLILGYWKFVYWLQFILVLLPFVSVCIINWVLFTPDIDSLEV